LGGLRGASAPVEVAIKMCISGSLLKERVDKTLIPLLEKERLGEVLPDHTKLQFST